MPTFYHLVKHFRNLGWRKQRLLYSVALMIFFFALGDSILTYIMPLLMVENGFSDTTLGLVIGSSSLVGAAFDVLASRYLRRPHYRRLYLAVLILVGVFGFLLFQAKLLWVFLLAMAVWGIYWDIFHFANYDFVSRITIKENDAAEFGVLEVFKALGSLVGPILVGLVMVKRVGVTPFLLAAAALAAAFLVYSLLFQRSSKNRQENLIDRSKTKSWWQQLKLWHTLGHQIFPFLFFVLMLYVIDASFWTIGPLLAESGEFGVFGGFLLATYTLPILLTGWFVGGITTKFGKKRTAFVAMSLGALILSLLWWVQPVWLIMLLVLLAASCFSLTFTSIGGFYADYITQTRAHEKEIQGLIDFFYNLGWIIGPVLAGFLADKFGTLKSFGLLGLIILLVTLSLIVLSVNGKTNKLDSLK